MSVLARPIWFAALIRIAVCVSMVACATTDLSPLGAGAKSFQKDEDEANLWNKAEEFEQRLSNSDRRYKDPALDAYLTGVAQRLLSPETRQGFEVRVKVLQNPLLNAFALPNGAIFLHTGMLARMESESQLSTVLGHELTHFTHRHGVRQLRNSQNKATLVGFAQAVLYGITQTLAPGSGDLTGPLATVWNQALITGYSRELETEADEEGLKALVAAGYDPRQAPAMIEALQRDLDERKVKEPFFFGTHPRLQDRLDNFRRLLDTRYVGLSSRPDPYGEDEFMSRIDQLLLDNANLDINLGRLRTARSAIEKHLKRHPQTAQAHFLMGEVHKRYGREPPNMAQAIAEYEEAARLDAGYSDPRRELGFLYRAQGSAERARIEFERYLTLSPQAIDAPIVRGYIKELEKPKVTIDVDGAPN